MLIITHQCNLNCRYCYESFKSKKAMPLEMAKEILAREFATAEDYEGLMVDFMGGEPLVQFELMREIGRVDLVPRLAQAVHPFDVHQRNIVHRRVEGVVSPPRRAVSVGLSLDGTPTMQRTNRGCSFQDIDLDFFLSNWPEQKVKMTVSCETLPSLAEGIIYLQERGFKVHANLGYGIPWNDSQLAVFSQQLQILGEYYLQHPDVPRVSLLDLKLEVVLNDEHPVKKYCGTGTHMHIYDVDGRLYPCHMFTSLVISRPRADLALKLDFSKPEHLVDPKCWECCGRELCPTCYGFNYKLSGDPAIRDPILCRMFKVQLLENCRFEAARLRGGRARFSREDCKKAKSVLKIHQSLTC